MTKPIEQGMEGFVNAPSNYLALDSLVPVDELRLHSFRQFAISYVEALALLSANVLVEQLGVSSNRIGELSVHRPIALGKALRRCRDTGDRLPPPRVVGKQCDDRVLGGRDVRSPKRGEEQLLLLGVMALVHEDPKELQCLCDVVGYEPLTAAGVLAHRIHDVEHSANAYMLRSQIFGSRHRALPPLGQSHTPANSLPLPTCPETGTRAPLEFSHGVLWEPAAKPHTETPPSLAIIFDSESGITMATSKTVMGKRFKYRGTLATGISIDFGDTGADWDIPVEIIKVIKTEITKRSPVLMGASRKPLLKDSVGETLYREHGFSPAAMTYILPLLVEDGFCTVATERPYLIFAKR